MNNTGSVVLRASAIVCTMLAMPVYAQNLPAGKGRDSLNRVCTSCHDLNSVPGLHYARADWKKLVDSMKEMGAEATAAEFGEIVDYLTLNFGPQKETAAKKTATSAVPPLPLPWEKSRLRIGQALYRENCVVCHDVDREESRKLGPGFYHLFQREKMPKSSGKPDRSYITGRIKFGGTVMPAFANKLTDAQIETLIDYLASK